MSGVASIPTKSVRRITSDCNGRRCEGSFSPRKFEGQSREHGFLEVPALAAAAEPPIRYAEATRVRERVLALAAAAVVGLVAVGGCSLGGYEPKETSEAAVSPAAVSTLQQSFPAPSTSTAQLKPCPDGAIDWQQPHGDPYMHEDDKGKTLCLVGTSRFGVDLDQGRHPLKELNTAECPVGYVSNWSLEGPNNYPIGFEVTGSDGSCKISNRDWWIQLFIR